MDLEKEMGSPKDFKQHALLFVGAHILMFILLRTEANFLSKMQESIKAGKIWFYHEQSGIFIAAIWLLILTIQGAYVYFIKQRSSSN